MHPAMHGYTISAIQREIKSARKTIRSDHTGSRVYFQNEEIRPTEHGHLQLLVFYNVANGQGGFVEGDGQSYHTVAL